MSQYDEHEQHSKRRGRDGEEIDRNNLLGVRAKEGLPSLRRGAPKSRTVFADGGIGNLQAEFRQLVADAGAAPGRRHPEIELALVRLYRTTGDRRLVDLAKFFVDERGDPARPPNRYSADLLDEMPLFDRQVVSDHAVRAGYYFAGATDIAALTGDPRYREVVERLWTNMVSRKLYLHGGIGAVHVGERFGDDYRLPNATAYCETCASVANMLWNIRLFRLTGESKYLDVLERVLYNGFLSGCPLAATGSFTRTV